MSRSKTNPRRKPATQADVERAKREAMIDAAINTVKHWPEWKREVYNTQFAVADGAKKY